MSDSENSFDIPTFFHTILFAYQKKLKEILGSGEAIFVHPVLNSINMIEREKDVKLIKGESLDEIFENFAKELEKTGFVKEASFEKLDPEKYIFCVEGCSFAGKVHDLLEPTDVACPYALIVMAIFQSVTGKKVKPTESEFSPKGMKALIESLTT